MQALEQNFPYRYTFLAVPQTSQLIHLGIGLDNDWLATEWAESYGSLRSAAITSRKIYPTGAGPGGFFGTKPSSSLFEGQAWFAVFPVGAECRFHL